MYNDTKVDTSPYAYTGHDSNPYNTYNGGSVVENYNDWEVEEFCDESGSIVPDSLFGLFENKKKKAEKKLAKAEKKIAKGNIKAAERKIGKATKILTKIGEGQTQQQAAIDQLAAVNVQQADLEAQRDNASNLPPSLSSVPMSDSGSAAGIGGGAGAGYIDSPGSGLGADSEAPYTSDEPTGNLAVPKTLGNVTVTASKTNLVFILIAVVVLIVAVIYFSKMKKK